MVLFYVIAIFVLIGIVSWAIAKIRRYVETRRYKEKLMDLAPQLNAINIENWRKELSRIAAAHSLVMDDLGEKYKVGIPRQQAKTVAEYVREESNYRRSRRKPAKRAHRKKWRYGRYY